MLPPPPIAAATTTAMVAGAAIVEAEARLVVPACLPVITPKARRGDAASSVQNRTHRRPE
jgi:hypothetical protein